MVSFDDFSFLVPLLQLSGPVYQTLACAIYDCLDARERQTRFIECLKRNHDFLPTEGQHEKRSRSYSASSYSGTFYQLNISKEYDGTKHVFLYTGQTPSFFQNLTFEGGLYWVVYGTLADPFPQEGFGETFSAPCFRPVKRDRFFSRLHQLLP